jgi:hypothetical protein
LICNLLILFAGTDVFTCSTDVLEEPGACLQLQGTGVCYVCETRRFNNGVLQDPISLGLLGQVR